MDGANFVNLTGREDRPWPERYLATAVSPTEAMHETHFLPSPLLPSPPPLSLLSLGGGGWGTSSLRASKELSAITPHSFVST